MRKVIAIRPEPGCSATVALGADMGMTIAPHPLFTAEPVEWEVPDAADYDGVLIGSANVMRLGGAALAGLTSLPALCVGEATATAARKAGFNVAATGTGGLQSVLPVAQSLGLSKLLRLSGEARVTLTVPDALSVDTRTCYSVVHEPIGTELAEMLSHDPLVLLHSGEAAAHFAAEVDRLGLARGTIALACLAPRIAQRAEKGWSMLSTAERAEDAALLALARQMCQS